MNKKNINFILKKYLNFQGRKKKEKFLESGVEMAKSHCTVYHRQQYYRYVITQHMLNSQFIFLKIGFFICKKVNSYKLGLIRIVLISVLLFDFFVFAVKQGSYDVINKAAEIFNNRTCLKWLPYTPELAEEVGHNHYVEFRNSGFVFYF